MIGNNWQHSCMAMVAVSFTLWIAGTAKAQFSGYYAGGISFTDNSGGATLMYQTIDPGTVQLPFSGAGTLYAGHTYQLAARAYGGTQVGGSYSSNTDFNLLLGVPVATYAQDTRFLSVNAGAGDTLLYAGDGGELVRASARSYADATQASSLLASGASGQLFQIHRADAASFAQAESYFRWFFNVTATTSYTLTGRLISTQLTSPGNPGASQNNPILPTTSDGNGTFGFQGAGSGWIDPPTASGYHYQMTAGSLFTHIADFPTGFNSPFTVSVNGLSLGQFTPGQPVDFTAFPGGGVTAFDISGITPLVDPANPFGFSVNLQYNTPTASFTATTTPEPSVLGLCLIGIPLLTRAARQGRSNRAVM